MKNVSTTNRPGWAFYAVGIAIAVTPVAVALNWGAITSFFSTTYTCENLVAEVVKISESNAAPGMPRVIGIVGASTVSTADDRVECAGTGVLSTTGRLPLNYSAHIEDGRWWIEFRAADQ